MGDTYRFQVKYVKATFDVDVPSNGVYFDLLFAIQAHTQLEPAQMKLVGIKAPKGKTLDMTTPLASLDIKSPQKVMVMAAPREEIERIHAEDARIAVQRAVDEEEERERQAAEAARLAVEMERRRQEAIRMEEERRKREEEDRERRRQWEEQERARVIAAEAPDPNASMSIQLTAFSAKMTGDMSLEEGNSVALPAEVLDEATRKRLVFPLTFQIVYLHDEQVYKTHVSVLSFTAQQGTVVLPSSVMTALGTGEGQQVRLRSATLPKASFLRLQPLTADWLDIPTADRRPLLEHQLRSRYQLVNTGEILRVQHNFNTYQLLVADVEPTAAAVSLVDTDVSVDIIEPMEEVKFNETLEFGDAKQGTVAKDEYHYYTLLISDPNSRVAVTVTPVEGESSGDPDLYISNQQNNKRPTNARYTWMAASSHGNTVRLTPDDPLFATGLYYMGVHGYGGDAAYTISVTTADDKGRTLANESAEADDPTTKLCPNCLKRVPVGSFVMHEMRCAKLNIRCARCNAVMRAEDEPKHRDVFHTPITCACGAQFEQAALQLHQRDECPMRLVDCRYCGLQLPIASRGEHQESCGAKTDNCRVCSQILMRRDLKRHVVEVHGISPNIDPYTTDYALHSPKPSADPTATDMQI